MRRLFLLLFLVAQPMWALHPARGDRVGILETSERHHGRMERAISEALPRLLREELRRAGFDARLMTRTREELSGDEEQFDFLVEIIYYDAEAGFYGGVGAGVPVGSVAVGAEVSMAYAHVDARLVLYDGETLQHIRSFDLQARTTSPALTGVGVGHREGFLFVHLPFLRNAPHRRVTRALARSAAAQIAAQ